METLIINQDEIMNAMDKLYVNFVKDGPNRRSVQYMKRRISLLEGYWREYESNYLKLTEIKQEQQEHEDHPYFSENYYDQTKNFYEKTKKIFYDILENLEKSQGMTPKKLPLNLQEESRDDTEPKQDRSFLVPQQHTEKISSQPPRPDQVPSFSKSVMNFSDQSSRLEKLMRKQQSNFKAFAHTLYNIDLEKINEKWEFQDTLHSIQSRWTTIDSLHWEIDSESPEDDEVYIQTFYKYERKFQDIKKKINEKMWSTSHMERSIPQMDIPVFSGNFH